MHEMAENHLGFASRSIESVVCKGMARKLGYAAALGIRISQDLPNKTLWRFDYSIRAGYCLLFSHRKDFYALFLASISLSVASTSDEYRRLLELRDGEARFALS
jgi:hypothetical protein